MKNKILHVCLASFYIDNFSYQENLLPKYHKKLGYDVEIIASLQTFDSFGNLTELENPSVYFNENNIKVTRLDYANSIFSRRLRKYNNFKKELELAKPDIIFVHGVQFVDILIIKEYIEKHPQVKLFIDNHADFSNSARNFISKYFLHRIIWASIANRMVSSTTKFYGVLPARVDFLTDVYNLPKEKVDLLIMGLDDDLIHTTSDEIKNSLRKKHKVGEDDFLIVTGGKIDYSKLQILNLMNLIKTKNRKDVKLIIFGSIAEEIQDKFESFLDDENIIFVGWLSNQESIDYFRTSDLVVFPGRHSVYWEQVVALGVPLVIKYWEGTNHVDIGGNCEYLYNDTHKELENKLFNIIDNKSVYNKMLVSSNKAEKNLFLYSNIAEKSISEGND